MAMKSQVRKQQAKPDENRRNSFGYLYEERTKASVRTKKRTRKADRSIVNAGYVAFLALMCIATVLMCVKFLQLKETVTSLNRSNGRLKTELTVLKSENDARYENVTNNVDWDYIRDVAVNKLHMKYADKDQIIWYNSTSSGYVLQYTDVPDKDNNRS